MSWKGGAHHAVPSVHAKLPPRGSFLSHGGFLLGCSTDPLIYVGDKPDGRHLSLSSPAGRGGFCCFPGGEVGGEEGGLGCRAEMGRALFIAALVLLLGRADGVRRDGLLSVVMAGAERNHPLSEGAISFEDSMNTFENKLPSARDVPPDFFCHSCLEVSKKVEKFLTDPGLYEEVDTLSSEVCQLLRSDLQIKCRQLVDLYLREGILFVQIVFLEKNLCNSTGFCPVDNSTSSLSNSHEDEVVPSTEPKFVLVRKTEQRLPMQILPPSKIKIPPFKVRERKNCDTCRVATERVRKGLEDQGQQIKIIKSLLEACESVQNYVNQCQRLVFQYGPLVMANLQKLLSSNDLCYLTHMCEVPAPPKGRTDHLSTEQMLQHLRSEVAKMIVL